LDTDLPNWDREHFSPGGGDPFLFYVAFGSIDTGAEMSLTRYRSVGTPDGIELMRYSRASNADFIRMFLEGYVWNEFKAREPDLAAVIETQSECMVLSGTVSDPPTLNYLRDSIGVLTFFLDNGAKAIYDPQKLEWYNPQSWRQKIFESSKPTLGQQVVILLSDEDDGTSHWVHTRGMRKFGRPDISVRRVGRPIQSAVIDLCNRLIDFQALGAVIPEGQQIRMESLPPGGVVHHRGDLDDPDFNNFHIEISWD
jgi:hypothetical protein